ncbi:E3 ubiquitin-protein ligase listerin-like [Paramacrobiotus metropolitanus]|uniref:E3 ubiquitin-protein ligase listerin-like n=1 Tax=Paramacrobiotus metropolitanus TaxID=2943436 RepID=UPI002445732B|nr:E3 ubiquitin-protein ligase listerin-like [Paramacrobiotus metropolitanus]
MSKDVDLMGSERTGGGKGKKKPSGKQQRVNPMGSWGAQRLLEEDRLKNPAAVQSTTQTLIEEGFMPSRQLLEVGFLDDNLYECLSRMEKKDPATKAKALLDFLQLLPTKSVDKLLNTRTFWARQFVSCMEDDDPRIRESACRCQERYISLLKKDTLPILPTIIGPWWLAQYQMHAGAAAAARSAFHSAFSEVKRPEVLRSAATPIFSLLQRRILPLSPHEKATKKGEKGEVSEEQQQRMAEALEAMAGFVRTLNEKGLSEVEPRFTELMERPEFWKVVKLSSPKVRQAFFELQRALWEKMENVAKVFVKENITAVVGNLHERDNRAAMATWSLFLLIMSKTDEWSSVLDLQKTIIPKVLSLLKNAGFGTAASTFPFLVVFLEKVPNKTPDFLSSFLGALIQGLSAENVRSSILLAVCTAATECFGYIAKKVDAEIAKALVEKYLKPLVQDSLVGTSNVIKGADILLKMVLTWLKDKQGESRRELAEDVLVGVADKLRYTSPETVLSPRTQKWLDCFFHAGKLAFPYPSSPQAQLTEAVETYESLQEILYQLLRLSFLALKNGNTEQGKSFLIILRNISSPVLYTRLKSFIEDQPTSSSPQLTIFTALSQNIETELLCLLLQDCRDDTDSQTIFRCVWDAATDKIGLLQALEKHGGFFIIERYGTAAHMEDLLVLAENLIRTQEISNLGKLLALVVRLQGAIDTGRLLRRVQALEHRMQLTVLEMLLAALKGAECQSVVEQIVLTSLQLEWDDEVTRVLQRMGQFLVQQPVRLTREEFVRQLKASLTGAPSLEFPETLSVLLEPLSRDESAAQEIVKLCSQLVDPSVVSAVILNRTDVFLVRITRMDISDGVELVHSFWKDELESVARLVWFSVTLLMDLHLATGRGGLTPLIRCVAELHRYIELAFGSGAPVVFDHELLNDLDMYRSKLVKFLEICGFSDDAVSFAPVESLSERELGFTYAELWKKDALPAEHIFYRNSVRDRLETLLAFAEFPRTCDAIRSCAWEQIQMLRIVPSLLSERCIDLEYAGPVLDVFGTVVIDWISCLMEGTFGETADDAKVLVLAEEAMEAVENILKAREMLKDAGMLWLELTEFSFPRILAALLEGLLRAAEEEAYLKMRPPLVGRVMATMCGLIHEFAVESQGLLRPVWDTLFRLEVGLSDRLSVLRSPPSQMTDMFIRLFSPLLLHKVAHVQLAACSLLTHMLPSFPPSITTDAPPTDDPSQPAPEIPPPIELLSVLEEAADIVETMLQDVPLGGSFGGVVPDTDASTYMLGYLLAWRVTLAWMRKESSDTRQALGRYLDANGMFSALLDNVAKLLPLDEGERAAETEPLEEEDGVMKFVAAVTDVERISAAVYREALQGLPMLARAWYGRKQGNALRSIGRYTAKVVSPELVRRELAVAAQQAREIVLDNFKVNVRPTVCEITAEYRVESWLAEIVVRVPKDYPLTAVQVSWGTTKGSNMEAWDAWVIRLSGFLRRQNGSLLEGILDWKRSVDRKFAGVENCAICLSVVEAKSGQLPQMQCRTCRNKFHNECLYRWFQQQVDPTCPLCREKFFT